VGLTQTPIDHWRTKCVAGSYWQLRIMVLCRRFCALRQTLEPVAVFSWRTTTMATSRLRVPTLIRTVDSESCWNRR
jgi:hypothetical protein